MLKIPKLSEAFPANPPLPAYASIPEQFKNLNGEWPRIASTLFFQGSKGLAAKGITLVPKDGVDAAAAYRAIKACLGSFEPKHEHKEAGVAYMLSEWFTIERDKAE